MTNAPNLVIAARASNMLGYPFVHGLQEALRQPLSVSGQYPQSMLTVAAELFELTPGPIRCMFDLAKRYYNLTSSTTGVSALHACLVTSSVACPPAMFAAICRYIQTMVLRPSMPVRVKWLDDETNAEQVHKCTVVRFGYRLGEYVVRCSGYGGEWIVSTQLDDIELDLEEDAFLDVWGKEPNVQMTTGTFIGPFDQEGRMHGTMRFEPKSGGLPELQLYVHGTRIGA
jgi:hypothetical protein